MRIVATTVGLILLAAGADALCANQCNGHGVCRAHDKCQCYPNWQGNDCGERTCPFAIAWADAPYGHNAAHHYAECSGRGTCDRNTGDCQCFDGYEGDACRRLKCPNACSGHGICESTAELGDKTSIGDFFATAGSVVNKGVRQGRYEYAGWDAKSTFSCTCDPGYTGIDCASRVCPRGNDPLTTEDADGLTEVREVVNVHVGDGDVHAGTDATGFWTLTFTDSDGKEWTTRPIPACDKDDTAPTFTTHHTVKSYLKAIPNHVIDDVEVSVDTSSNAGPKYSITFTSNANSGARVLPRCNYQGCNVDGCQPRFAGIGGGSSPQCVVTSYYNYQRVGQAIDTGAKVGTAEDVECSNRGQCDRESGLCACYEGYTGEACSTQTILI